MHDCRGVNLYTSVRYALPHLFPALRRMAEHSQLLAVRGGRPGLHAPLPRGAVRAEYHRARMRGEEARKCSRECELFLLVEEVEERRGMNGGDMALKGVQRPDAGQFRAGFVRWAVEWLGGLKERGIKGVSCEEGDREGLLSSPEELVPEVPEF